ncbi:pickpocket protein 19 [Drosophila guanche]|uniref:Blast:Pickpocket protein 19 n=1 Tax=Drosophila guanche TaxID=7266 RepID=A0A3B0KIC1_DROGU|nr:pickpocket protein 19 [Drosophila guanche]SPP86159.1 blast:Pickpocket protein 19 [Drosophila guanche]
MTLVYFPPSRPQQSLARRYAQQLGQSAWQLALRFGKRTTIHGLDRLLGARASRWERFVWLCTFVSAFLGAIYVCLILSQRYNDGHFQTVVDSTRYPVYRIPFPVITICNRNRLNWDRLAQAKSRFLPNVTNAVQLNLFERIVSSYDDVHFGHFQSFERLRHQPTELLNHVNFSLVVDFMSWSCDELLSDCLWRHYSYNCCEIFSKRRSKNGLCWAFNSLETIEGRRMQLLDPMWPWRTGSAGPMSALSVRVLLQPDKHWPGRKNEKGIDVMVTEPFVWHKDPFYVPANTETSLEIEPIIYFYDNDTRGVSSAQRQCVFDDEHTSQDFKSLLGYVYMIENCQSQCHQEYLVRFCNCTMDLLFPPGQYRSCRSQDLLCLAEHNDLLRYSHQPGEEGFVRNNFQGMLCKCYRNCYSLNYISDVRPAFLPPDVYGNYSYVDLDVHYRFETIMVYRTSLVFGWVDLMVSFGGIAGLFLGCSLISGMELAYFLCIEVPAYGIEGLRQHWRSHRKRATGNSSTDTPTLNFRQTMPSQLMEQYIMQLKTEQSQRKTLKQKAANLHNWQRLTFAHKHVISK